MFDTSSIPHSLNNMSAPTTPNSVYASKEEVYSSPLAHSTPDMVKAPDAPKVDRRRSCTELKIRKLILPSDSDEEEEDEMTNEEQQGAMEYVREKYRQYSETYVQQCTDIGELHQLLKWYNPQSCPRNDIEWNYIFGVLRAVKERLRHFKCLCSECELLLEEVDDEQLLNYL